MLWSLTGAGRAAAQETGPPQRAQGRPDEPARPPASKDDILEGTDESDTLTGGDADNWLFGREGDDFLRGGAGQDALDGAEGADTIDGGDGDDVLDGGDGGDTLRGGDGNDILDGGDGDDTLEGGPGDDDLDGGDGNDFIGGGPGDDVLAGGDGNDRLDGGLGNDRISGNDAGDGVLGGPGDDVLSGGDGGDLLAGGAGNDVLDGGQGDDVLRGGPGDDVLLGSGDADLLDGEPGHDIVIGGDGDDTLFGAVGDDLMVGGLGADVVRAQAGNDIVLLRVGDVPADDLEILNGGPGTDMLVLNGLDLPAGVAGGRLDDPRTGGVYLLRSLEQVEYLHLFPHVDTEQDGESFSLLLVNPSETMAEGRVVLSSEDGSLQPLAVGGEERNDVPFAIPPLGLVSLGALASGAGEGSAQVFANVPLGGLGSPLDGASIAGAADVLLLDSAVAPVLEDEGTGASTGVTVVNGPVRSIVKLTLFSQEGQEPGPAAEIDLPPYGRRTVFVRNLFPLLGDFTGTVTIEGGITRPQEGGPIAATVVQRLDDRVVSTYPAVSVGPLPAGGPLVFTDLPTGDGVGASLTLVNPSRSDRAQGTLSFFDENGTPREVSIDGREASASAPFELVDSGSAVLTLEAPGAVTRGSVRVEMVEGVVSGVARVTAGAGGPFDAGPSPVVSGFIVPVRRDIGTGVTTRVTLSGTDLAGNLELTLRNTQGDALAGGTATLAVPANGQVTRSLEELFPDAPAVPLAGTLTATADAPVGVRVVVSGGGPSDRILMPVTPLR